MMTRTCVSGWLVVCFLVLAGCGGGGGSDGSAGSEGPSPPSQNSGTGVLFYTFDERVKRYDLASDTAESLRFANSSPFPALDSRELVTVYEFEDSESARVEIFGVDGVSKDHFYVTNHSFGVAKLSPDRQRVLLGQKISSSDGISVFDRRGNRLYRFVEAFGHVYLDYEWVNDAEVLLSTEAGEIYQLTLQTGATRLITRLPFGAIEDLSLSPAGHQIAFTAVDDDASHIYVVNLDGTSPYQLTTSQHYEYGPTWSPDGRQLAVLVGDLPVGNFYSCDSIYLITPAGNTVDMDTDRHLAEYRSPDNPEKSRECVDGLVYWRPAVSQPYFAGTSNGSGRNAGLSGEIFFGNRGDYGISPFFAHAPLPGGNVSKIHRTDGRDWSFFPSFDGTEVTSKYDTPTTDSIIIRDLYGNAREEIDLSAEAYGYARLSPSGTYLAAGRESNAWARVSEGVTLFTRDGRELRNLHADDLGSIVDWDWTPAEELLFIADQALYRLSSVYATPEKLFDFPDWASQLAISPDGSQIAVRMNLHIWKMNLDGSQRVQVTTSNTSESSPAWSPDGKHIALVNFIDVVGCDKMYVVPSDGVRITVGEYSPQRLIKTIYDYIDGESSCSGQRIAWRE